jgi:DNA-binding NarL/FixJ family response regulator
LIDELPLRRTSTLKLLRTHFREGTHQFASIAELSLRAALCTLPLAVIVVCIGGRSIADALILEKLRHTKKVFPDIPIIILSDREEAEELIAAFHEGIQGYIPTSLAPDLVVNAIRMVSIGGMFYPADALIRARRLTRAEANCAPPPNQITARHHEEWPPRQLAVLHLLVQGKANKQIAQTLAIEEGTVKVHLRQIMRKLGVTNRTQAALGARRLGIMAICEDTPATIDPGPDAIPASTGPPWLDGVRAAGWLQRISQIALVITLPTLA